MTIILLTLGAFLIMATTFYHKPDWGLGTVICLLPFERIGSYVLIPHAGHPVIRAVQVAGAALLAAYVVRWARGLEQPRIFSAYWYLAGVALVGIVPIWRLHYGQLYRDYIIGLALFGLSLVIAQLATPHRLGTIYKALFGSATVVALFGVYQYVGDIFGLPTTATGLRPAYTKAVFGFPRIQSTALEPLYYANYLLLPVLVGLALVLVDGKRASRIHLGILGLLLINLMLTMSRGGVFAAVCGILVLVGLLWQDIRKHAIATFARLGLIATAILLVAALATAGASELHYHNPTQGPLTFIRLFTTQLTQTGSYTERQATLQIAKHIFYQHPIFGVGIGGFGPAVLSYPKTLQLENWPTANNAFWELLAELGVVGFCLLLVFIVQLMAVGYRALGSSHNEHRAWLAGLLAAVVAIIIQYQSFTGFFLTHIWVSLGLLAGLSAMAVDRPKNVNQKTAAVGPTRSLNVDQ